MHPLMEVRRISHATRWHALWLRVRMPLLALLGVIAVFWKIALTKQYTFLASPDLANQVLPRLSAEVFDLQHFRIPLWSPYEWFGAPLLGEVEPAVASPFT